MWTSRADRLVWWRLSDPGISGMQRSESRHNWEGSETCPKDRPRPAPIKHQQNTQNMLMHIQSPQVLRWCLDLLRWSNGCMKLWLKRQHRCRFLPRALYTSGLFYNENPSSVIYQTVERGNYRKGKVLKSLLFCQTQHDDEHGQAGRWEMNSISSHYYH